MLFASAVSFDSDLQVLQVTKARFPRFARDSSTILTKWMVQIDDIHEDEMGSTMAEMLTIMVMKYGRHWE